MILSTRSIFTFFALAFLSSTLHAGTVTIDFRDNADTSTGVNTGGLDDGVSTTGLRTFTSADPERLFSFVVSDPTTMSTFTGQLALTGLSVGPTPLPIDQFSVVDGGSIQFSDTATLATFFEVGNLTETTSNGSTIVFNGLSGVQFGAAMLSADANADVGNDMAAGGIDLDAAAGTLVGGSAGAQTFTPIVFGTNQFAIQRDAGTFNLSTITLDFTVTAAVPEPSSMGLFAVGGFGLLVRRRRDGR